jgi:hypothetical protein
MTSFRIVCGLATALLLSGTALQAHATTDCTKRPQGAAEGGSYNTQAPQNAAEGGSYNRLAPQNSAGTAAPCG